VQAYYLGDADRKRAIEDFKKPKPGDAAEAAKPENRFQGVEIFIVCDMLLTGFDAPIVQAMYLDKGIRDHTLLQAIACVNRPYDELKEYGLIIDYFGVFENLNEALNYDKDELGEVAFPFSQFRERFKQEIAALSAMFAAIERTGTHATLIKALMLLNDNEDQRSDFERLFRNVRILFETLQPDDFLRPHLAA
jgi:type I restriction enzyme R subunit